MSATQAAAAWDVTLTGLPRSGTTLVCHLLNKLPEVVALNEPMRVEHLAALPDRSAVYDEIGRFFADTRRMIATDGMAPAWHVGGEVPDNVVRGNVDAKGLRKNEGTRGLIRVDKTLPERYLLCVKHPAAFTALLPGLAGRFPTFAVVRNPLSVLASWNSVNMAHGTGHAPAAEGLDGDLRSALAGIDDALDRQLCLIDWFFAQYRDGLMPGHILRYEDIIASGGAALVAVTPAAAGLREPLKEKNANAAYRPDTVRELSARLLAGNGAYWDFYSREDVERVARAILG